MPEWALQLLIGGGLLSAVLASIAKLFNVLHAAWLAKEAQIEKLQGKVESLLMDANAYLKETDVLRAERIVMDKQLAALVTAMIAAQERNEAFIAKILKDGR